MKRARQWLVRFLGRHRPALVGFALIVAVASVALVGPWVTPYAPNEPLTVASGKAPLWLGKDPQDYDLFTRLVYGARTTLLIALAATVLSMIAGTLAGAIAGFAGKWTDVFIMRAVDFAMSFPAFLLAVVFVAILGRELHNLIVVVGLVGAPLFARQVRAEIVRVSALEYIAAARALGLPARRVLLRHALPNSLGPVIVLGTLGMGSAVLEVAGLTFLGLGGDPYVSEWGVILKQGWDEIGRGGMQVTLAGLAIFITVLGFNLFGDGLKDELDPRTGSRTRSR